MPPVDDVLEPPRDTGGPPPAQGSARFLSHFRSSISPPKAPQAPTSSKRDPSAFVLRNSNILICQILFEFHPSRVGTQHYIWAQFIDKLSTQ